MPSASTGNDNPSGQLVKMVDADAWGDFNDRVAAYFPFPLIHFHQGRGILIGFQSADALFLAIVLPQAT